jgi:peroxisomal 2,4-dienoyl-CoA reductase
MNQTFKPNFLAGKVAIVTGGATGICYGISLAYLTYGSKVLVTSRKEEVLKKSCE